jgi:hypothetical protein
MLLSAALPPNFRMLTSTTKVAIVPMLFAPTNGANSEFMVVVELARRGFAIVTTNTESRHHSCRQACLMLKMMVQGAVAVELLLDRANPLAFVREFARRFARIDRFLLSAGAYIFRDEREKVPNQKHLHELLEGLWPFFLASADARIVLQSSFSYKRFLAKPTHDLSERAAITSWLELANHFASRGQGAGVSLNGYFSGDDDKHYKPRQRAAFPQPERAETMLRLLSAPEQNDVSARFFEVRERQGTTIRGRS